MLRNKNEQLWNSGLVKFMSKTKMIENNQNKAPLNKSKSKLFSNKAWLHL